MELTNKTSKAFMINEERYRSLAEVSTEPLISVTLNGTVNYMNPAAAELTGLDKNEVFGNVLSSFFTEPEKLDSFLSDLKKSARVESVLLTIRHKSGMLSDVIISGKMFREENDGVSGIAISLKDVRAVRQLESELREARSDVEKEKQLAQEALQSRQQFLSNMSHEMRTPLNAIIGFTRVMLKTDLSEKQKEYLEAIRVSGDALIILVNDILDLAKADAGKMTFEQVPFRLSDAVQSILQLFEPKVIEKNLQLIREYDHQIPELLLGDPVRVHQILLNLISNAVKYTREGSVKVSTRMLDNTEKTVTAEFVVSDTGPGIPQEKIPAIFEHFERASGEISRMAGESGFGLAIVKQLVNTMGGAIRVESHAGSGTSFIFTLVFRKIAEDKKAGEKPGVIRVLVAEDVTLNQLLIKTLLQEFGFDMEVAANGRIAVEKLQENHFDVVLMDLQMPEMNGFEATEYIRNNLHMQIPIIALTADVTSADAEKCRLLGMNDYLAKPVDEKLLYTKIMKYTEKPGFVKNKIAREPTPPPHPSVQKTINLDYLREHTQNNSDLMKKMIGAYIEETPQLIGKMKESIDNMDWESLSEAAHTLMPSFAVIGIHQEFEDMAKKIKENASRREDSAEIGTMVQKIEEACNKAIAELEDELKTLK